MDKFSENLKKIRESKNWTQQDLADKLFVTKQAVSKWESGKGYPDGALFSKISEVLDISLDLLVKSESFHTSVNEKVERLEKDNKKYFRIFTKISIVFLIAFFALFIYFNIIQRNTTAQPIIIPEYVSLYYVNYEDHYPSNNTFEKGTVINEEFIPERDGYTFVGWYYDSNFNRKVIFPMTMTEDCTFYAKWEPLDNIIMVDNVGYYETSYDTIQSRGNFITFHDSVLYYDVTKDGVTTRIQGNKYYQVREDGDYSITAFTIDKTVAVHFYVDSTEPTIEIVSSSLPNNGWYSDSVTIKGNDSRSGYDHMIISDTPYLENGNTSAYRNKQTIIENEITLDSPNYYFVEVYDKHGNREAKLITIDNKAPEVNVTKVTHVINEYQVVFNIELTATAYSEIEKYQLGEGTTDGANIFGTHPTDTDTYNIEVTIPYNESVVDYKTYIEFISRAGLITTIDFKVTI